MNIEDIIELWKSVGWNNEKDYFASFKDPEKMKVVFPLLQEKLNPDIINPKVFWKATDIHFGFDTVANTQRKTETHSSFFKDIKTFKDANDQNHRLVHWLGVTGYLDWIKYNAEYKFKKLKIGEVGCGYGSLKENYVNDTMEYIGFDVIPRFDGVVEIEGENGTFSENQIEQYKGKFNLIYSFNVFQHLSKKQIEKYIEQFAYILPKNTNLILGYVRSPNGITYHYGQVIELFTENEFINILIKNGFAICAQSVEYTNRLNPICYVLEKII